VTTNMRGLDCTRRDRSRPYLSALALAGVVLLSSTGCGSSTSAYGGSGAGAGYRDAIAHQQYGGGHVGGTATGDTQAGAAFARWVLEQDPQREYITDAVVRGENTLGIKVNPTITKGELQQLLPSLAEGMARTFPGKAITVNAFYQTGDKLAEAHYDPRSGRVDIR